MLINHLRFLRFLFFKIKNTHKVIFGSDLPETPPKLIVIVLTSHDLAVF
jgi:predicted TIM-barrel fold metal-dependent hydrolase